MTDEACSTPIRAEGTDHTFRSLAAAMKETGISVSPTIVGDMGFFANFLSAGGPPSAKRMRAIVFSTPRATQNCCFLDALVNRFYGFQSLFVVRTRGTGNRARFSNCGRCRFLKPLRQSCFLIARDFLRLRDDRRRTQNQLGSFPPYSAGKKVFFYAGRVVPSTFERACPGNRNPVQTRNYGKC